MIFPVRILTVSYTHLVPSMRKWNEVEIRKAFTKAYYENPLLAVKWLFYLRDIRGNGMGERRTFRICFKWLVENHFDKVMSLVELIPEYGRYDDWICLLDSKANDIVMFQIKRQLEVDICNMEQGKEISLLGKWLPSCNASSSQTKLYAKNICKMLGFKESEYRKTLSALRAYLNAVSYTHLINGLGNSAQAITFSCIRPNPHSSRCSSLLTCSKCI